MSSSSGTNMTLVVVLATTGLTYMAFHTYKFDKWKCLVPRRKEWFRVLLTYLLILSFIGIEIWAIGWCYVKYQLGWVVLPRYGAMPYPAELWTQHYRNLNLPLTFWMNLSYSLHVSLNAEEGLYWYHLMRAVRSPRSAKAWLSSSFFFSWIAISLGVIITMYCVTWINVKDMHAQMARMFAVGGLTELIVVSASTIVIWKFPAFLQDVKASGAGPEVRSRLHFYHEGNKVRTFFRFGFSICTMILGIDGLTGKKRINLNHIASDMLQQIAYGCYFLAGITSIILYLPRNWSNKSHFSNKVMVGHRRPELSPDHAIASNALMSLLREGGQWDEVDDVMLKKTKSSAKAFDDVYREGWDETLISPQRPRALENWQSPFEVPVNKEPPKQLRIRVEQEVHDDSHLTPVLLRDV